MRASRVELGMLFRYDPAYIQVVQRAMSTRHLGGQNIVRFITVSSNCAIWRNRAGMSCRTNARSPDATRCCSILRVTQPSWVGKVILFWLLVEPSCSVKLTPGGTVGYRDRLS
jgi:hypothetical protein